MGKLKNNLGIPLGITFMAVFVLIARCLSPYFDGASWYLLSSFQRLLFFAFELHIFLKLFKKGSVKEVIHLRNFKAGIYCGSGIFVYIVFYLITYCWIGAKSWVNTTVPILLSCLILQQFTTGLWEELTFRVFICEGYYQESARTAKKRLLYSSISFLIFGAAHAIESSSQEQALYRFIITGVWGFIFATVYLHTHSFLAAAFLHFFSDIFLNLGTFIEEWNNSFALTILDNYVQWIVLGILFVIGIIVAIKEPISEWPSFLNQKENYYEGIVNRKCEN